MEDRPINPEPSEYPKIKKAFRAAEFSRGIGIFFVFAIIAGSIFVGLISGWFIGVAVFVVAQGSIQWFVLSSARCPRCGYSWGRGRFGGNETETFVCGRCRLNIGMGLRE
jgi:hypothetical protein